MTSDIQAPARVIDFPPFRLDLDDERLWREGMAIRLRPKTFAVLRVLVGRAGQLVTKDEIWSTVWRDTKVTDDTLTKSIRELRRALGDLPDAPRFIETVHARGFRWLGPGPSPAAAVGIAEKRPPQSRAPRPAPVELSIPVVGRDAELGALDAHLEAALDGRRQVVLVGGEAGIGKTTLIDAFFARIAGDSRVAHARGQSVEGYGAGEAYLPVLEALERLCRSSPDEGPAAVLRRHAPMWLWHMPSLVEPADRPALQRETAGATQHRMVRELARALEVLTADRGVVLCIDDLHWGDVSTLMLLDFLARRREPARLLLVGVFRPADVAGPDHPLAALRRELRLHDLCAELTVSRLDEAAIEEYARRRFGDGLQPVARALATSVHRRTEGNPLFMVHVLNDLVARGALTAHDGRWELHAAVEPAEPPHGVRQFIEQQLERLTSREREVLEAASVAGLVFSAAAVAAGLEASVVEIEEHCASLVRREQFLEETGTEEWADGTVASRYRFLHQLHHEVLCARVTSAQRAVLHRRIGVRKEEGYGTRALEIAPQLAHHFEEGRDPSRAVRYLAGAAEVATRRRAPREAIAYLERALDLLAMLPEGPERDLEELSLRIGLGVPLLTTRGYAAPEVERTYARARTLCRGLGTIRQLFPVLHGLWVFYEVRGELGTAHELAGELMTLAEREGDTALLLQAHHVVGETAYLRGELTSALTHLERAITLYDAGEHEPLALLYGLDPGVVSYCYAGWTLAALGRFDRAAERIGRALALTRAAALPLGSAVALIAAASVAQAWGETRATEEQAAQAIDLSVREGFPLQRARAAILHGWALTAQGQDAQGVAEMRAGLDASVATGARAGLQYFLALLAEALGRTGDAAAGLMVIDDALVGAAASGERHYEEELRRLRGELLLLRSDAADYAAAEACFREALERARDRGARALELRAGTSLAQLWRARGKRAKARELLGAICEGFADGVTTADLRAARALLDELRA